MVNPWWWVSLESAHVVCRFWCGHSPVFLLVLGRWVVLWSRLILIVFVTPSSPDASSTRRLRFGFNTRDAIESRYWPLVVTGKPHNAKRQDARRVVPTALFLGLFISGGITCVAGSGRVGGQKDLLAVKDLWWNKLIHCQFYFHPKYEMMIQLSLALLNICWWPSFITSSNLYRNIAGEKKGVLLCQAKKKVIPFGQDLT